MVSCLSNGHPAIRRLIQFANDIIQRTGESKRAAIEEQCTGLIFELGHMKGRPGNSTSPGNSNAASATA